MLHHRQGFAADPIFDGMNLSRHLYSIARVVKPLTDNSQAEAVEENEDPPTNPQQHDWQ